MNRLLTAICLLVFGINASPAAPPDAQPRLGINLAGPADWMTELPFVDVFRTARPWISQKKGAGWGQGPELALDEFGWIKRLEGAQMKDWTVDQMLDHFEKTAFTDSLNRMRKDKAVADKYGVKLIAYEGGQHMVAFVKDQELVRKISATMHACNRHPRMGDMYRRCFDEWAKIGGDVFAVFSSIGRYSNHGVWGLAEYYDSRPADYPKLEATLRWAKNHGQPVEADQTEYEGQELRAEAGAATEILGAFVYPLGQIPADRPIFENRDSRIALVYGTSVYRANHKLHILDVRGNESQTVGNDALQWAGSRARVAQHTSDASQQ